MKIVIIYLTSSCYKPEQISLISLTQRKIFVIKQKTGPLLTFIVGKESCIAQNIFLCCSAKKKNSFNYLFIIKLKLEDNFHFCVNCLFKYV